MRSVYSKKAPGASVTRLHDRALAHLRFGSDRQALGAGRNRNRLSRSICSCVESHRLHRITLGSLGPNPKMYHVFEDQCDDREQRQTRKRTRAEARASNTQTLCYGQQSHERDGKRDARAAEERPRLHALQPHINRRPGPDAKTQSASWGRGASPTTRSVGSGAAPVADLAKHPQTPRKSQAAS